MKMFFEDPSIEVTVFTVEDVITVSGMRGGIGMNPGFDELEDDKDHMGIPIMPPCF